MAKLRVFFVRGCITSIVDDVIALASHGEFTHTAIDILGGVLESLGETVDNIPPGVRLSPAGKYDNRDDVLIKIVDVPDLAGAKAVALELLGKPYGYSSCLAGAVEDNLGIALPDTLGIVDDCSETVTRVLRGGGNNILPDIPANAVTPMKLLNALGGA